MQSLLRSLVLFTLLPLYAVQHQTHLYEEHPIHLFYLESDDSLEIELGTPFLYTSSCKGKLAVNGGFFRRDGSPVGALVIQGKFISSADRNRGAVGWKDKEFLFDRLSYDQTWRPHFAPNKHSMWSQCEWILGGAGVLLWEGKPQDPYEESITPRCIETCNARTAICQRVDKKIALLVTPKPGLTLHALTSFLQKENFYHALNLDGGGSTTCLFKELFICNQLDLTSLEYIERPVSNALVVK